MWHICQSRSALEPSLPEELLCYSSNNCKWKVFPSLKEYIFWFVFRTALQMLVTSEHNSVLPTMMSNTRDTFTSGSLFIMILLLLVLWNVKLWERTWLWSLPQKCWMVLVATLNPWICASVEFARYVCGVNLNGAFLVRLFALQWVHWDWFSFCLSV